MTFKICGYENLHAHSDGSLLDGYARVSEYCDMAKKNNQQYISLTDHGMLNSTPELIRETNECGLNPIFGSELYCQPLQREFVDEKDRQSYLDSLSEDERKEFNGSPHLLALAYNETGMKNLTKLVSWGWLHGHFGRPRRPRVNREIIKQYKEGIIFTSCCYASEVGRAYDKHGEETAEGKLLELYEIFGENYYLEIMMLDFNKQKGYDRFILKMHDKYHIPLIITNDCHFARSTDSKFQRYMLMIQSNSTIAQVEEAVAAGKDRFEIQDGQLWYKGEDDLNTYWKDNYSDIIDYDLLCLAKATTVEIARRCSGIKLDRSLKLPKLPNASEQLKDLMIAGFKKRNLPHTNEYLNRLKKEYSLICRKEFSSYFLIIKKMVDEARKASPAIMGWGSGYEAVSPGRGSAAASLICYCLGITDVDPVKEGLLFERFLSEARGGKSMKLRFSANSAFKSMQVMNEEE